ncbi:L-sorbose 1-dehydrogenase-like [Haemaphysalis longicornis]
MWRHGVLRLQPCQTNAYLGERQSTSRVFLEPILEARKNLHVSVLSHATKVIFEGKVATGVEFYRNNTKNVAKARIEVILSSGSIGSAQLLLLSGVGPRDELEKLHIPAVQELPVGRGIQDHLNVMGIQGTMAVDAGINLSREDVYSDYEKWHNGFLAIPGGVEGFAFASSTLEAQSLEYPDFQLVFASLSLSEETGEQYMLNMGLSKDVYNAYYTPNRGVPGFLVSTILNRPRSRGCLRLRSRDPFEHPIIDPKYLSNPQDVKQALQAARTAAQFIRTPALRLGVGAELWNVSLSACDAEGRRWSDAYLVCLVRHLAQTTWHACCSCPMGSDYRAVVDPRLRVRGVERLRVVDASVMPQIVSGNLNVPVIMIADKASAMLLEDQKTLRRKS